MSDTEDQVDIGLFEEPSNFRPKTPEATFAYYSPPPDRLPSSSRVQLQPSHTEGNIESNAESIKLRLVGFSPLWGHHLWNAAPVLSDYMLLYREMLLPQADTCVLELGAASGLPSIVAARILGHLMDVKGKGKGKAAVVSTDYPDPDLIQNLRENLLENGVLWEEGEGDTDPATRNAVEEGYIWGSDPSTLLSRIEDRSSDNATDSAQPQRRFNIILLSDLIFNHQAHDAMLDTCEKCLCGASDKKHTEGVALLSDESLEENEQQKALQEYELPPFAQPGTPCCLVFYSHHRPHLAAKDLDFFHKARSRGWHCKQVVKRKMPVMFREDPGSEQVRGTVWGWAMTKD